MEKLSTLERTLDRINGRGYKAYKDVKGVYRGKNFTLIIDHVQGDPFAAPSRVRVRVNGEENRFPEDSFCSKSREVALRDYIARRFYQACRKYAKGNRGSGKSGLITVDCPGQEILERSSVVINRDFVEVRFVMGLPAFGRRVAGEEAREMFFSELPIILEHSLIFPNLNREEIYHHITTSEDADFLRTKLDELNLIAFIAEGAILPRRSGIDPRPMDRNRAVAFSSPESFKITVDLPNRGKVTGMGIPKGITLIVGGGYHGKSTVLKALEQGVYNHIPGDGRELVVTNYGAFKIRAEDGRRIEKTCITPFISNLPYNQQTEDFSSDDASGSTSQAANIIEAMDMGATAFLIDEDTSATNFMIRDHRMQELVSKEKEPITPFIDKVGQLYREHGISTILVIGGSGDYFDVADNVICMSGYIPQNVTREAKVIAEKYRAERKAEGGERFGKRIGRIPLSESFNPRKGKRDVKITTRGLHTIQFGVHNIDLGAVEQLVDVSQTRAIGDAIFYARQYMDGNRDLKEVVELVFRDIRQKGLDVLSSRPVGDYAIFRELELAAAINRLRTLKIKQRR